MKGALIIMAIITLGLAQSSLSQDDGIGVSVNNLIDQNEYAETYDNKDGTATAKVYSYQKYINHDDKWKTQSEYSTLEQDGVDLVLTTPNGEMIIRPQIVEENSLSSSSMEDFCDISILDPFGLFQDCDIEYKITNSSIYSFEFSITEMDTTKKDSIDYFEFEFIGYDVIEIKDIYSEINANGEVINQTNLTGGVWFDNQVIHFADMNDENKSFILGFEDNKLIVKNLTYTPSLSQNEFDLDLDPVIEFRQSPNITYDGWVTRNDVINPGPISTTSYTRSTTQAFIRVGQEGCLSPTGVPQQNKMWERGFIDFNTSLLQDVGNINITNVTLVVSIRNIDDDNNNMSVVDTDYRAEIFPNNISGNQYLFESLDYDDGLYSTPQQVLVNHDFNTFYLNESQNAVHNAQGNTTLYGVFSLGFATTEPGRAWPNCPANDQSRILVNSTEHPDTNSRPVLNITYDILDTCSYTSGDWNIACNDNCTITSDENIVVDAGADVTINGTGTFILEDEANLTNWDNLNVWGNSASEMCYVIQYDNSLLQGA